MRPPLPPILFSTCLLAGWAAGRFHPLNLGPFPFRTPLTILLLVLPLVLAAWALLTFRRHRTTPEPHGTPTAMVEDGPYRFTRNPMYLSLVILLTGFALLLDSLWVLVLVPVLAGLLDRLIIPGEEARLQRIFGEVYTGYTRRVRRWI
ncbi:isoprenylcysteine carboxylmethyltransferase family protein [Geothrix sp. 21YS21S-2]|uniref:methyltransferase family protein n=1 Tax=Geothrix sp. 21YS21S-2 TaxID=3068893 RepID=UPI0027B88F01|nr:isoprenylcysteine carboxylmethyltransferase family protein [Geothrix sp. 21YS21S-2]